MSIVETEWDRRVREQAERLRAERDDLPGGVCQALDLIEGAWGLRPDKPDHWHANGGCHDGDSYKLDLKYDRRSGKLLVICRKGCEQDAVIEALKAIGVTLAMLGSAGSSGPTPEVEEPAEPKVSGKIWAEYPYVDEHGRLLFVIERRTGRNGKKTFGGRAPDGKPSIDGIRRVLYRLDKIQGHKTVYVVEGEKCVQALEAVGLVATCNPHGAGKWELKGAVAQKQATDTYVDQLVAAGVEHMVVLPDNDGVGRSHAGDIVESLIDRVLSVKLVSIPGLKHKGDVADFLAEGGMVETLQRLVDRAPIAKTAYGFADERLEDVQAQEISFLWEPYVPSGSFTIIAGDPGGGKTMLSEWIASVLTAGQTWLNGVSAKPGVVVALAVEDNSATSVKPRMEAMGADCSKFYTLKADRRSGRLVDLSTDLPRIRQYLIDREARMLIISPINAYVGKKINTGLDAEVRQILSPLAVMAEELDIAVVGIMHLNKAQQESILYKVSGSIGFVAASRASYLVVRDPKDRDRRYMTCIKTNDFKEPTTLTFRIDPCDPGNTKSAGKLTWTGGDSRSAVELFKDLNKVEKEDKPKPGPTKGDTREWAAEMIRDYFEGTKRDRVKAADFKDWVEVSGFGTIPNATLNRAVHDLGIEVGSEGEDRGWWTRPTIWPTF
jgi:putative DNA primase/helicase